MFLSVHSIGKDIAKPFLFSMSQTLDLVRILVHSRNQALWRVRSFPKIYCNMLSLRNDVEDVLCGVKEKNLANGLTLTHSN